MRPEILEVEEHGRFCIADCYVIISTTKDDPHLQHYNPTRPSSTKSPAELDEISANHLIHTIYTWIGSLAEMDKRFCCAMFAVGVKNLLGVGPRVMRQAQGEETADFTTLFPNGEVAYDDESFAAESGLFVAERRRYQLRLYRVSGKPHVRMSLVQLIFFPEEGQDTETLDKILLRDSVGQEEDSFVESDRVAIVYRVPEDGTVGDVTELVIAKDGTIYPLFYASKCTESSVSLAFSTRVWLFMNDTITKRLLHSE
ncbi:UNVERIFIED_CONTAM: hypothetical protein HDU68_003250 [Siphonaria sp. JEL0065]|nr:hypothetical protein HDU68_003250 [Siphonaria sp. JEL0065]